MNNIGQGGIVFVNLDGMRIKDAQLAADSQTVFPGLYDYLKDNLFNGKAMIANNVTVFRSSGGTLGEEVKTGSLMTCSFDPAHSNYIRFNLNAVTSVVYFLKPDDTVTGG